MNLKKISSFAIILLCLTSCVNTQRPTDIQPTEGQQAMINRKYGMFLHFGMNTYLNKQWSDGTDPASAYTPPADIAQKAIEWVKVAKRAGMRSIVLTTKHHEGFCLWDSKYTEHDIANPTIKHKVDLVKAVSETCQREGIAFSVYYSLWDRNEPTYKLEDKYAYIEFMKNQLHELMTQYGPIAELWFDGGWDREVKDWYLQEIYDAVKKDQPNCQISTNWTLGKRPIDMQEGDSIIYFPSDFRLWDPFLPVTNDPKIYTYGGKKYYLPYECTQTISVLGNWFSNETDKTVRDLDELEEIFYVSTSNDNCLLLNIPPDKNGDFNPKAVDRIYELAHRLSIENGQPFPKKLKEPQSITTFANAEASSIYQSDTLHYGAPYAVDSDVCTSWRGADSTGWIIISLAKPALLKEIFIIEGGNRIKEYMISAECDGKWQPIYSGKALSDATIESFMGYGFGKISLSQDIKTKRIKVDIQKSDGIPEIYSIRLK